MSEASPSRPVTMVLIVVLAVLLGGAATVPQLSDTTPPVVAITKPECPPFRYPWEIAGTASDEDSGVAIVKLQLATYYPNAWYYWNWQTRQWVVSLDDSAHGRQSTGRRPGQ